MRSVEGMIAWLAAIAIIATLGSDRADADAGNRHDTLLYFSGFDLWRHGAFAHDGFLWSPGGLDREGFTLKLMIGAGLYRYHSGPKVFSRTRNAVTTIEYDVNGRQITGSALPGWRFVRDKMIVTVFAGLDLQHHWHSPMDPGNRLRGSHTGVRAAIEFWYEPDAQTMWAADASVSSIGPSYSGRIAFGWRLFDKFYAGPEIAGFSADDTYGQWRAGLHLTGLKAQRTEWSAAIGWSGDSEDRNGLYGRLGLLVRR